MHVAGVPVLTAKKLRRPAPGFETRTSLLKKSPVTSNTAVTIVDLIRLTAYINICQLNGHLGEVTREVRRPRRFLFMAEIALLVAEEYEKSRKWRKEEVEAPASCIFLAFLSPVAKKSERTSSQATKLEVRAEKWMCNRQQAVEPKSSFGLAAMEGFFPA